MTTLKDKIKNLKLEIKNNRDYLKELLEVHSYAFDGHAVTQIQRTLAVDEQELEHLESQPLTLSDLGVKPPTEIPQSEPSERHKVTSDNNGGSTDYYKFDPSWVDLQDLIEAKEMHWNIANIFKACYRLGTQDHSSMERDLNKMEYFIQRHKDLIHKSQLLKDLHAY